MISMENHNENLYVIFKLFFILEKKVITITKKQKDVVPVPRVRRVLPEHEGKYKVIMPAGAAQRKKQAADNAQAGECGFMGNVLGKKENAFEWIIFRCSAPFERELHSILFHCQNEGLSNINMNG